MQRSTIMTGRCPLACANADKLTEFQHGRKNKNGAPIGLGSESSNYLTTIRFRA